MILFLLPLINSRLQWALPDLNHEVAIEVGRLLFVFLLVSMFIVLMVSIVSMVSMVLVPMVATVFMIGWFLWRRWLVGATGLQPLDQNVR